MNEITITVSGAQGIGKSLLINTLRKAILAFAKARKVRVLVFSTNEHSKMHGSTSLELDTEPRKS